MKSIAQQVHLLPSQTYDRIGTLGKSAILVQAAQQFGEAVLSC